MTKMDEKHLIVEKKKNQVVDDNRVFVTACKKVSTWTTLLYFKQAFS